MICCSKSGNLFKNVNILNPTFIDFILPNEFKVWEIAVTYCHSFLSKFLLFHSLICHAHKLLHFQLEIVNVEKEQPRNQNSSTSILLMSGQFYTCGLGPSSSFGTYSNISMQEMYFLRGFQPWEARRKVQLLMKEWN